MKDKHIQVNNEKDSAKRPFGETKRIQEWLRMVEKPLAKKKETKDKQKR